MKWPLVGFHTRTMAKTKEELKKFKYDEYFTKEKKTGWFDTFLDDIEKDAKCKKGELMQYLAGKHGYYSF